MDAQLDGGIEATRARAALTALSIHFRERARDDVEERYAWLAAEAGFEVAERMTFRVDEAVERLAQSPGIGSPVDLDRGDLAGLRKGKVADFANLLIFYIASQEQLSVIRVLYTAQDWHSFLAAN